MLDCFVALLLAMTGPGARRRPSVRRIVATFGTVITGVLWSLSRAQRSDPEMAAARMLAS
jgi:hypothetical protein